MWFKELAGIGDTKENLAAAAEGENYEWTDTVSYTHLDVYKRQAYPDATFGMGHMINRKVQAGTGNLAKEPRCV